MIIYRVENDEHQGPYTAQVLPEMNVEHQDEYHPAPWEDKGIERSIEWGIEVCCFDSLIKLEQWFGDWLPRLLEIGFKVKQFEVDQLEAVGVYQCLVLKEKLERELVLA